MCLKGYGANALTGTTAVASVTHDDLQVVRSSGRTDVAFTTSSDAMTPAPGSDAGPCTDTDGFRWDAA